ncbi:hypothetical protein [Akkermansia sp.]|uniref:hypothetical protein n=1 Tax=Akkermansia sp. TaxID=1872421 RepID=UPI0025BDFBFD|nr:hypothetical protein [Akkermansia sp.]
MKKIILTNIILLSAGFLYAHEKDMIHKVAMNEEVNLEKNESSSPVVIEGVKNRRELDSWIENYVTTNYPGYSIGDKEVDISSKESIIETVYLKNEQGNVIEACFDITDYMKKFRDHNKKEIIKISRDIRKQKQSIKKDEEKGSSYHFPIELSDAKTEKEVLKAQKDYLEKHFPDYQIVSRATWVFGKKFIDRIRLEKEDNTKVLMFDVSSYINEYKKTHEIKLKEIAPGMISVEK